MPYISLQFGSIPALVAASVALSFNNGHSGLPEAGQAVTERDMALPTRMEVTGATGFVVAIAALAILLEVGIIILRFCNVGLVNLKFKIFLAIVSMTTFIIL